MNKKVVKVLIALTILGAGYVASWLLNNPLPAIGGSAITIVILARI